MIRVILVDDHTIVRDSLCRLLESENDIKIIGQTGSGKEAIQLCKLKKPDVVILDFGLPDIDGLEVTKQILDLEISTKILILTMYANEEYAIRLLQTGASGYIVKAASSDELINGIRKVANKGIFISQQIVEKVVSRMNIQREKAPESLLSNREMQVLIRLASGDSTREASNAMHLSLSTIETYRSNILEKLNLRNNSDLTRFAIRRGLIDLD
jgi:two-component system, NarL family, invasion response regulator UvrY